MEALYETIDPRTTETKFREEMLTSSHVLRGAHFGDYGGGAGSAAGGTVGFNG